MTAQGHARTVFRRAIENRNLLVAETTAREIGTISLEEALSLVLLVADLRRDRFDAYARRFVARLATERDLTLRELDLAITALRALPSRRAEDVLHRILR